MMRDPLITDRDFYAVIFKKSIRVLGWPPLSGTRPATPAHTNTHVICIELKETPASACTPGMPLAPAARAQRSM